jgi:dTDP-4-dehydrorhamnose reductase
MKVLILGSKGQLGRCLYDQLAHTDYEFVYSTRSQIDIVDFKSTRNEIVGIAPDVVINATAYTAVDKAEQEEELADLINHLAVANIANTCLELDCWLVHVSTDYVFDGTSTVPYGEDDRTNPQSVYGDTKLRGELSIQSSGCKYLIIRTAWLFSEYGKNFLTTMLRLGSERAELSIVGDQVGCPTYGQDLAKAIKDILPALFSSGANSGVYHYCGDQPCSWYLFAVSIFKEGKNMGFKTPCSVHSIGTKDYPTPAVRPVYSVLDCSKIKDTFCINPSNWHNGLEIALTKLKPQVLQ